MVETKSARGRAGNRESKAGAVSFVALPEKGKTCTAAPFFLFIFLLFPFPPIFETA